MLTASFLQSVAQVFTERMLNGMAQGVVLAAVAWILLKIAGRSSSSTRFAVWFVALLGTVVLPLVESDFLGRSASPNSPAGSAHSAILIPSAWALYLFFVWGVVAFAGLSRVVVGLWQIRRLRQTCTRIDPASLDLALLDAVAQSGPRAVTLYSSSSLRVPMATGFFHPMIVIPEWALRELSADELKVVLLHESAHLRRGDDWTNLAQKVLRALFFFHPVVWWIEGHLSLEREMACDDLVVARTASPRAYAECLVALAEKNLGRRSLAFAQAAVNRVRHTSLRIRRILDTKRVNATSVWTPAVGLVLASALACFVYSPEAPQLVGFRSEAKATPLAAAAPTLLAPNVGGFLLHRAAFSPAPPQSLSKPRVRLAVEPAHRRAPEQVLEQQTAANVSPTHAQALVVAVPERAGPTYQNVAYTTAGAASEIFFLVTQDQQWNPAGDQVLRINVYRLTVFYPLFYPANPQKTLSKSI